MYLLGSVGSNVRFARPSRNTEATPLAPAQARQTAKRRSLTLGRESVSVLVAPNLQGTISKLG